MTGIGAIATSPAISTLIAAALYIATYLSFLRLLRYPRNWYLPTLPASLATAGLAAITVAQVSVSSDGLDLSDRSQARRWVRGPDLHPEKAPGEAHRRGKDTAERRSRPSCPAGRRH